MSRFKLICEDESVPFMGASKIKHEFDCDDLNCILTNMTKFLQGSGYLGQNQKLELGRDVNLDVDSGLDKYTENLFVGGGGTMNGTFEANKISTLSVKV